MKIRNTSFKKASITPRFRILFAAVLSSSFRIRAVCCSDTGFWKNKKRWRLVTDFLQLDWTNMARERNVEKLTWKISLDSLDRRISERTILSRLRFPFPPFNPPSTVLENKFFGEMTWRISMDSLDRKTSESTVKKNAERDWRNTDKQKEMKNSSKQLPYLMLHLMLHLMSHAAFSWPLFCPQLARKSKQQRTPSSDLSSGLAELLPSN